MSMFYVSSYISRLTLRRFLRFLHEDFTGKTLYLYINSVGGCTRSALAMYEVLRTLVDDQGINVVSQVFDECYSAALVLFLAGEQRYATKHATFLVHEVTVDESKRKHAEGYKSTAIELEKETQIIFDLIKSRTNLTHAVIKRKVKEAKDNDWTFGLKEAKRYGIVSHPGFYMPDVPTEHAASVGPDTSDEEEDDDDADEGEDE